MQYATTKLLGKDLVLTHWEVTSYKDISSPVSTTRTEPYPFACFTCSQLFEDFLRIRHCKGAECPLCGAVHSIKTFQQMAQAIQE